MGADHRVGDGSVLGSRLAVQSGCRPIPSVGSGGPPPPVPRISSETRDGCRPAAGLLTVIPFSGQAVRIGTSHVRWFSLTAGLIAPDLGPRLEVISFGESAVADEGAGGAGEGVEVVGFAFVETAAAGEPGHGAFDGPAVAAESLRGLDTLSGDAMGDAAPAQPSPQVGVVVALVGVQLCRLAPSTSTTRADRQLGWGASCKAVAPTVRAHDGRRGVRQPRSAARPGRPGRVPVLPSA